MKKIFAVTLLPIAVITFSASPLLASGYTLETESVEQVSEALPIEDESDAMEQEDTKSINEVSEALPIEDQSDSMEQGDTRSAAEVSETAPVEDQPGSREKEEGQHRGWSLDMNSQ